MSRSDYLNFGGLQGHESIDAQGTLEYLESHGWHGDALRRAREASERSVAVDFVFDPLIANYCDFCFAELMGGEFDVLSDGRERCIRCSRTATRTEAQFHELFVHVRRNMDAIFEISVRTPTLVRMVNANEIARRTGEVFQPTPGVDARVLGFAAPTDEGSILYMENGAPKLAAVVTMSHELTHIWQFANWDVEGMRRKHGAATYLAIQEGMACWVQVQYLLCIREFDFASRQHAQLLAREDEYGVGYRAHLARYPLKLDGVLQRRTPFHVAEPF